MIKDLYDSLIRCKYDVSLIPQEKRPNRKLVLRLADIDIEVSDSQFYNMPVYMELEWNDTEVLEIPEFIKKLCGDVERDLYANNTLRRGSFRWDKVRIVAKAGSQYNMTLTAMYMEEIQI